MMTTDGIGNFKEYLKSCPKIACLLKEPYDEEAGERPLGVVYFSRLFYESRLKMVCSNMATYYLYCFW